MNSLVTIVISVHNNEQTLPRALESVAGQSDPRWSLIAINDGSSDQTHLILREFFKKYPHKVRIFNHRLPAGLTHRLIEGCKLVRTPFIGRLDGDDWYANQKIALQIDFFDHHPNQVIVGCQYENIYSSDRSNKSAMPLDDHEIRRRLMNLNPFCHSCIIMRQDAYHNAGGYDPAVVYGQDYELWFRMLAQGKAANLPEVLCNRLVGQGAISQAKRRQQMLQLLKTRWRYANKKSFHHWLSLWEPIPIILMPKFFIDWLSHKKYQA